MKKNKKILVIFGVILLFSIIFVLGGYFLINNLPRQSILSVSNVNVDIENGKVFWVVQASSNKADEIFSFSYKPNKYTMDNGTEVTPKQYLSLTFSPEENKCEYQVTKREEKYNLGLSTFTYYTLSNPERIMNIEIVDGNGISRTMDGTIIDSVQFSDSDGRGSVVVETQGALTGKYDCPDYDNVAVYKAKDGNYGFFYYSDLRALLENVIFGWEESTLSEFVSNNDLQYSTFASSFDGTPSFNTNEVVGNLENMGSVVFTITADQDYFDSFVYTPPQTAEPKIGEIVCPDLNVGDSSSISAEIINEASGKGLISVKASSYSISISPSATNVDVEDSKTIYFSLKAGQVVKDYSINLEACGVDQFSSVNCVSKTCSGKIVSESTNVNSYCGDGICQENENFNFCPEDCEEEVEENEDKTCPYFWQEYHEGTDGGLFGLLEGEPAGCYTAGWVYFTIGGAIVFLLIIVLALIFRRRESPQITK